MIKQKIYIIGCKALYDILIEIKNNLSFDIHHCVDEKEISKKFESDKIDIKKSLFLSKKNSNCFDKNSKINKKQIIQITDVPADIYSLTEKINIQLIKLRYNFQSKVVLKNYILNLNSREIYKDDKKLKLTEKEVNTIIFLLNKKIPQSTKILLSEVWGYLNDTETHTVETHIHRLRKKFLKTFNDSTFILSYDNGYLID